MTQQKIEARTGGQVLVEQLLVHGADCAHCVPGKSYLKVLDSLHDVRDRSTLFNARHEADAADMAEAYGKLTGRPGICLVTRGPGACHAAVGVHVDFQDSTPMILLVGQVRRDTMDRESFQEIDYRAMFTPVAEWAAQFDDARRVPEYMVRAFRVATSPRPGPVVLALPEDMLTDVVEVPDAEPFEPTMPALSAAQVDAVAAELAAAERPLLLVGGPGWSDESAAALRSFVEAHDLPVVTSFRRQDILDNRSDSYVGDFGTGVSPALVRRRGEADLLLVIEARLGEITTKTYASPLSPDADAAAGAHPPRRRRDRPHLHRRLAQGGGVRARRPRNRAAGRRHLAAHLRDEYLADTEPPAHDFPLDMGAAMAAVRDILSGDCVITPDAGNHTGWRSASFAKGDRSGRWARPAARWDTLCPPPSQPRSANPRAGPSPSPATAAS